MRDAKTDRHLRYVSFVLDVYTNGQFATGKSKENDLIVCVPTDSKDLFSIKMIVSSRHNGLEFYYLFILPPSLTINIERTLESLSVLWRP